MLPGIMGLAADMMGLATMKKLRRDHPPQMAWQNWNSIPEDFLQLDGNLLAQDQRAPRHTMLRREALLPGATSLGRP